MYEKLVEVTWDDHAFHQGEIAEADAVLVVQKSIGYLVHQDDKVIKLAQTQTSWSGKLAWAEVLVIDKRMMRGRPRVIRGT